MKCASALPLFCVLFVGCASAPAGDDIVPVNEAPTEVEEVEEVDPQELEKLERKLGLAHARLQMKEMEVAAFDQKHASDMSFADAAIDMAETRLVTFREADAPSRRASEELDLTRARDRAQEAMDELAQIQIMYEGQDLDDLTAEFVVSRGRRQAERAQAAIAIQEAAFKALTERKLPLEESELELALERARADRRKTELDGEIGRRRQAIAIREAQHGIMDLEQDIAKAQEEAKP